MRYCPKCKERFFDGMLCPSCGGQLVHDGEDGDTRAAARSAREIFSLLVEATLADGVVTREEKDFLVEKGRALGLEESEVCSMLSRLDTCAEHDGSGRNTAMLHSVCELNIDKADPSDVRSYRLATCKALLAEGMDAMHTACFSYIDEMRALGEPSYRICEHLIRSMEKVFINEPSFHVSENIDIEKLKDNNVVPDILCENNKILLWINGPVMRQFALSSSALFIAIGSKKIRMIPYSVMTNILLKRNENDRAFCRNGNIYIDDIEICFCEENIGVISVMREWIPQLLFLLKALSYACCSFQIHTPLSEFSEKPDMQKELHRFETVAPKLLRFDTVIAQQVLVMYKKLACELADRCNDRQAVAAFLILTLLRPAVGDSSLFLCPEYNIKKLNNARFFQLAAMRDEDILCYYDSTAFGGGDNGFVLTSRCLYSSEKSLSMLFYENIQDVIVVKNEQIAINQKKLPWIFRSHIHLARLLEVLACLWKHTSPKI